MRITVRRSLKGHLGARPSHARELTIARLAQLVLRIIKLIQNYYKEAERRL